jgi:hypothetical protein
MSAPTTPKIRAYLGALVELRGFTPGARVLVRGVERVVSPEQVLVLARTEHQGDNEINITEADLREAAANVRHWPLIPVDFDHASGRGGKAGGLVLPESVRVGTDPVSGLPALFAQLAYNPDVADGVRAGEWLGGSVRLIRPTDRATGKELGTVLGAWSLTNTPQQHDIEVRVDFAAEGVDKPSTAPKPDARDGREPHGDELMDKAGLCKALGLAPDASNEDVAAAVAKVLGVSAPAEEQAKAEAAATEAKAQLTAATTKLAELTAERDAERKLRASADAKVIELSAGATDAQKAAAANAGKVIELTAKVEQVAAELTAERKARLDTEAKAEVDGMLAELCVMPAEEKLARTLRGLGAEHPAWVEFKATHATPQRQKTAKGSGADGKDTVAPADPHKAGIEFQALVDAEAKAQGIELSAATSAVKATPKGAALHAAMTARTS